MEVVAVGTEITAKKNQVLIIKETVLFIWPF